ncbi:PREDICTED: uncharacterized protein LOC109216024 [Nicotiana attenuata]|uniref:uncharacterized protein LOC109216024 n=1 Tax=Nicotiana attenuata TaxID=49451 RepID=UPI0009047543|nr:PREDICTED: uncharacterized protein LOC109216024 [Nicotiana attenuata]
MNKQYGLQMTYMQAWRLKEYAVQVLRGNPRESYEKLPSYFYMLVLTNPMSVVTPSTSYLYLVLDKGKQRMVFLKDRTCSCRRFQLDELPCAHAWAVLKYKYIDHIEYCSVYYTRKYLLMTYEIPIYPISDESTWKIPVDVLDEKVLPPDVTKTIGRPRKGRCKPISERERKRSISCGQCGEEGHSRKTCRNNPKRG